MRQQEVQTGRSERTRRKGRATGKPPSGSALLNSIRNQVAEILPTGVTLEIQKQPESILVVRTEGKPFIEFSVVELGPGAAASAAAITKKLAGNRGQTTKSNEVIIARYISEPARLKLRALGQSYLDAAGNFALNSANPPLVINQVGAGKDPWRGRGRPKLQLKGPSTQALIRYLVENQEPYPISKVIEETGIPRGTVYRVLDMLRESGWLERTQGQVSRVDWEAILEAWTEQTSFFADGFYLSYKTSDLDAMFRRLAKSKSRYVATATFATQNFVQSAGVYAAMLHASDPAGLAAELGLEKASSGANVVIAYASTELPFFNTGQFDGVVIAGPSLLYRDLMSGPGRNPEESQYLLAWMRKNVAVWRK
jgi:hypothetical protein